MGEGMEGPMVQRRGDYTSREEVIRAYFGAWLAGDPTGLPQWFDRDILYTESYGPQYQSLGEMERWFAEWVGHGQVERWDIKGFWHDGDTLIVEWYFRCVYEGNRDGFDGVTLASFTPEGKIVRLKEFASKPEHTRPFGE